MIGKRRSKVATMQLTVELDADTESLATADKAVGEFAESMSWPQEATFKVKLVLEEILMNVISHGGDGTHKPHIRLDLSQQKDLVSMEISDDGIAYDPLTAPAPDLESDLEDRPIGGLGVYLIRELMDSVSYRFKDGRNHLLVTKTLVQTGISAPAGCNPDPTA
jgi:anti-sigma regulatory factor (Ser/Thr protein kinase)